MQLLAQDEACDLFTVQAIALVGGKAERPFGQAGFAKTVDEEREITIVAKMGEAESPACKATAPIEEAR